MGQTTATRQRIFKNVIWSKLLNIRSDTHEKLYKGSPKRLPQERLHHPLFRRAGRWGRWRYGNSHYLAAAAAARVGSSSKCYGGHFRGSGRTSNVIPWSIHGAPENSREFPIIPEASPEAFPRTPEAPENSREFPRSSGHPGVIPRSSRGHN